MGSSGTSSSTSPARFTAATLALVAFAIPIATGAAVAPGVDDPALAKALGRCHKAATFVAGNHATLAMKSLKRCLDAIYTCVQTRASDPACLPAAQALCDARFSKIATSEAKARAALTKRCGATVIPYATLQQPNALDIADLAELCALYEVPDLDTYDRYLTCLLRQHDCQTADLLAFESRRAAELLALTGRSFPSRYCPNAPIMPTPVPTPVFNKVFVTSTTHYADTIGSAAGADAICTARAAAAGITGTFRAWFSDANAGAAVRLGAARGFIRVDGAPFADELSDLAGFGQIFNPLNVTENGKVATGTVTVWTGTTRTGVRDQFTCLDWTSRDAEARGGTGRVQGGPISWTARSASGCDAARRLFCFQVDYSAALNVTPAVGKRVFLSVGNFVPGGGITAADQICAGEAIAAGFSGNYKALLATTTAPAVSRFTLAPLYVRPDGIAVGTGIQLAAGETLPSGLWQNAFGTYGNNNSVWTGAATPSVAGSSASTCDDWTSTASASGVGGATTLADATWWAAFSNGVCSQGLKLYCLED